ncbi:SDR family NAD(P)-dependent oxidoreductase [Nocardiopsis tropica]
MTAAGGGGPRGGVAVVGMAGRFPGAADLSAFWANLREGVESIGRLSEEELEAAGVPGEESGKPDYVRAVPRFEGADEFDAEFFGYTAREAQVMDPQHRLFLETSWQALEDAGYDAARHDGAIGVFGGAGANRYLAHVHSHRRLVDTLGRTQVLVGNELGFLSTRVSYKLDLKGPSLSLRTACSTALVAVHTACRSLLDGECDMALSGGVHVDPGLNTGYVHQEGSFLSPDGHVRPFDADARGTVFGTGVGVVVLKRLEDALADRDTVHAVIRGSAVNNDGAVKVGFTAPSVSGQAAVVAAALARAGLDPGGVDYVEAHGTGTALGDPIEVQALSRSYTTDRRVRLGTVKGNVGHLDAAAGIAGLLKTVLALEHGELPPTLNHRTPNPDIDFAATPFDVVTELTPWPRGDRPRRAGVSAFGFGGTNAHLVLEEAPAPPTRSTSARSTTLLTLSARTPEALEDLTDRMAAHLRMHDPDLTDTGYTLAVGRREFPHRRTVTGPDAHAVAAALETRDPASAHSARVLRDGPPVVFLFSGQGSQHPRMAHGLYGEEPHFRAAVDECARILQPLLDTDIRDLLLTTPDPAQLDQTRWTQPALFVLEYALARLWQHWGITPTGMLGHSLGEWTAATLAGVFTLPDALRLVALRGQLMQDQAPGAMLNTVADREAVQAVLPPPLSLAAHNGPRDCVVSGPREALDAFARTAREHGWSTQEVATSHAFHSELMAPMVEEFTAAVAAAERRPPVIPFVSNVTGDWITPEQAQDPGYWGRHILATVEFAAGVLTAAHGPHTTLLEVGPGQTLRSLARRVLNGHEHPATTLNSLPHRRDPRTAVQTLHQTLGQLWLHGTTPDWDAYHADRNPRRIPLPTHPFHRKKHWLDKVEPAAQQEHGAEDGVPRRHENTADWFHVPSWQRAPLPLRTAPDHSRHWMVLTDGLGVGGALARRLREGGARVTEVAASDAWTDDGYGRFTVDPASGADHDRLLAALADGPDGVPTRIVHCWSVTAPVRADRSDPDTALRLGFESLVRLTTSLSRHADGEPRRFWVLSNGLHCVTGDEVLDPAKATLLGPCRVMSRELPDTACRSVDIDCGPAPDPRLVDRLAAELASEPAPGTETVAHRGPHRWAQHFLPHPLPPARTVPGARRDRVHLITGGTGGLGLALAEHLASDGARIVLTSRTGLPPAEEWGAWLDAGTGDRRTTEIVHRLKRLRDRGAQLLVVRADVTDRDAMRAVVDEAVRRWGGVHTVFHAAGLAGGGLIQLKDLREAAEVLRPKVRGTLVLEEVLADQDLDHLVLFGSNGANIGSAGQVDYCAANCFLDAFAQDRGRRSRVVAVDWGAWKDVGMSVTTALPSSVEHSRRLRVERLGMSALEGLRALDTVLAHSGEPQVVVSPADLSALFAEALAARPATVPARHPAAVPGGAAAGRAAPGPGAEAVIREVWQDLLGVERVGAQDSFFDLGGDSLIAIQLVGAVNARLGSRVTLGDLYEGLTVAHLAGVAAPPEPARDGDGPQDGADDALRERRENAQKRRRHQQRRRKARGQ